MARGHQRAFWQSGSAAVLSLLALGAAAFGQQNMPAQQTPPMPAPFSQDCQLGGNEITADSQLPNVAAALQQRKQIRILAIGASFPGRRRHTRGGHVEEIRHILQDAIKGLDVVMINRGVSGELSAQAAPRIKNEVALTQPDLVLWQVGTNDALAYVPLDDLEDAIVDTLRWLKEHKVDVVLVGLQYVDPMEQDQNYRAVRELLRKVATEEKVMIVRRYEAQRLLQQAQKSGGGLVPDEFERSEAGYVCLAQYMARAITLGIFGQSLRVRPLTAPQGQGRPSGPPDVEPADD
jgi:lysophospholipase L1-like esterase